MPGKQPHIVIFNPDQWRGDVLGHMGDPAAVTPNLDRAVATDAVSFRRAFCQNTVCTPSRCSFMTGWYPHVHGHRTMYHMLREHEPVLLRQLKDAGYYVWWGGKNDLLPGQDRWEDHVDEKYAVPPEKQDLYRWAHNHHVEKDWRGDPEGDNWYSFYAGKIEDPPDGSTYYDGDWANVHGAIDRIHNPPADRPMCIYIPIGYPHPPYAVEDPYYSMIDPEKIPPRTPTPEDWSQKPSILKGILQGQRCQDWSEDRWRELRRTYYGMCTRVDHQFGLLCDALKEAGIYDETAIFLFSDHGDFTGDYGLVEKTQNTFEDCLSRVPLIVKPPKDWDVQPRVSEAMVELIDFTATTQELAGIEPDYTHFGRSLREVVAGETDQHRDAVFCEGGRLRGEIHCMELQSTSNQNSDGLYYPRLRLQTQDEVMHHTKAAMCRTKDYKYVRRFYETDELYDLNADPRETTNRIDDPSLADVLAVLKDRLLTWYQETCDVVPHESDERNFRS